MFFLLFAVIFVVSNALSFTIRNDPRCVGVSCDAFKQANWNPPSTTTDAATCLDTFSCPTCLSGPVWDQRKIDLGTGTAVRQMPFLFMYLGNWLSAEMSETLFKILIKEFMGYNINTVILSSGEELLCCVPDTPTVWLERWPGDSFPDDSEALTFEQIPIGYAGHDGFYVLQRTIDQYPLATAYNAYRYLSGYGNIFPKVNSTRCEDMLITPGTNCEDANYVCSTNIWTNTSCVNGRYIPPLCVGNPNCQELIHPDPLWDSGFAEGLLKNLHLNFTVSYVGVSHLPDMIINKSNHNESVLFYWGGPDPLLQRVNAVPIQFPTPSLQCTVRQNEDPTLTGGDCDYGNPSLMKVIRRSHLADDRDLKLFFQSFGLPQYVMDEFMRLHTMGGGNMSTYDIACGWAKNNYGTWKDWIKNTPPPSFFATFPKSAIIGIAVGGGCLVLIVVAAVVYFRSKAALAVKYAPKKPPLALIFTDVESSTKLWEQFGNDMAIAMEIHHELIRQLITEHCCYEVKTIGDSFMIACPTLVDATLLCIAMQRRLHEAEWPSKIKYWKSGEDQSNLWCGLRVRAGIHWCVEVEPKFDTIHQRYDYYGHDVNCSARVESLAQGGQILMTSDTCGRLLQDPDFADLVEPELQYSKFCSGAELKGVSEKVTLFSFVPVSLAGRQFEPIPGTIPANEDTTSPERGGEDRSDTASRASGAGLPMATKVAQYILTAPSTQTEKQNWLQTLIVNKKINVPPSQSYPRKLNFVLRQIETLFGAVDPAKRRASAVRRSSFLSSMQPSIDVNRMNGVAVETSVENFSPAASKRM